MRNVKLPHEIVAAEIRAEIARQRIPQVAIATAMQLSQASVSRKLNGRYPLDVNDLYALAGVLRVPAAHLLPDLTEQASA